MCMRALRARLGNVPNEITIYTYTTKTTKRLFSGRFVLFVGFVAFVDFVIPLGYREIVISLKPLLSWVFGGYRETVEIVDSVGSVAFTGIRSWGHKKRRVPFSIRLLVGAAGFEPTAS